MARNVRGNADGLLVTALAAGQSVPQAAQAAGMSARTAFRRLATPGFRERVEAARAELVAQTVAQLAAAGVEAVAALRAALHGHSPHAAVNAARALLEFGVKYRETEVLERRISELEAAQGVTHAWPSRAG
jgi:hypothetical protein